MDRQLKDALYKYLRESQPYLQTFARQAKDAGETELGDDLSKASGWMVQAMSRLRKEGHGQRGSTPDQIHERG